MEKRSNKPVGSIKVSDSVIIKMAELAAAEIDGVYCRGRLRRRPTRNPGCLVRCAQDSARKPRKYTLTLSCLRVQRSECR